MTDRELLELAAKAAGMDLSGWDWSIYGGFCRGRYDDYERWNPIEDDGEALRLAVTLELLVHIETCYYVHAMKENISATEHIGNDGKKCIYAATRRAIVRAAAEIGKSM